MESPPSSPEPNDWNEDSVTELSREANAYAATPQLPLTPASQSTGGTQHQAQQQQQKQQPAASSAEAEFVPLSQIPTFELPGEYLQQHAREVEAGAAAAAAMESIKHAGTAAHPTQQRAHMLQPQHLLYGTSSKQGVAAAPMGSSSMEVDMPPAHASSTAMDVSTAFPNSSSSSRAGWHQTPNQHQDWTGQQQGLTAHPSSISAAGGPSPVLPAINEVEAAALRSALQQQDDQHLLQAAAAVSSSTVGPAGSYPGFNAAAAEAAGLPSPNASVRTHPRGLEDSQVSATTQLSRLDLKDQQQQPPHPQQHYQQQAPQQQQQQAADSSAQHTQQRPSLQQEGHGELDLNDLLGQPGPAAATGMDLDSQAAAAAGGGGGDIPVLEQPQPQRQPVNVADALLQPGSTSRQDADTVAAAAADGGGGIGLSRVGDVAAAEGLGLQDFGLPLEAAPAYPDEPVRLLNVPEPPADSYLV